MTFIVSTDEEGPKGMHAITKRDRAKALQIWNKNPFNALFEEPDDDRECRAILAAHAAQAPVIPADTPSEEPRAMATQTQPPLTPQLLAAEVGVDRNTIYKWVRAGVLPVRRAGSSLKFDQGPTSTWAKGREFVPADQN
jgi:hypothetical protein